MNKAYPNKGVIMKLLSISLFSLVLTANCFALECGSFPGDTGRRIPGTTTYSVKFENHEAILTLTNSEVRITTTEETLEKARQNMDGATYENDEYKVFSANAKTYLEDKRTGVSIRCK
jgi:hypothetical protein